MEIKRLDDLFKAIKGRPARRLVAVNAVDEHSLEALFSAVEKQMVEVFITGDLEKIENSCMKANIDASRFTIIQAANEDEAGEIAADMIREGKADFLMKGLLSTDKFMRILLNKEYGLLPPKGILSHVAVIHNQNYHKLLIVSDVAIIPYPDLTQKIAMARYMIQTAHALGIRRPKVAVIAATEQVLAALPACTDAAIISKMGERGQISGAIIDGPMALDVALDEAAADIKQVISPVAGNADCLLFPNIDAGNVFYKMGTRLCHSEQAAIVAGAKVPVVLSSRGDSMQTKLYSIALAALLS
jgi:phosphate butyryltransferase